MAAAAGTCGAFDIQPLAAPSTAACPTPTVAFLGGRCWTRCRREPGYVGILEDRQGKLPAVDGAWRGGGGRAKIPAWATT
jgi:hypothetical protein